MIVYVDTSAYLKLIVKEDETEALRRALAGERSAGAVVVSSILLLTELQRGARRLGIERTLVDEELKKISLLRPTDATFERAGGLPSPSLRSLDALHLSAAIECGASVIYVYDERLRNAASEVGLSVRGPGRSAPAGV